ncbi:uncharacterized protein [Cicer arietinum]|uniref:Uncharacterized protein LOC101505494 n=1 Tax=Cicer arietinum TaxID=3827 RepID=A0A1S2YUF1_CICAR|nr:uncharacterized protein LOC101505494 [Cicer arietinum]
MVFKSVSNTDTPPISPPPPPSSSPLLPPPQIVTPSTFYLASSNYNFPMPNTFRWTTNHPTFLPSYTGMNAVPHWGPSSNHVDNNSTRPILHLGPYSSLTETHLNRAPIFRFTSDPNREENRINSILRLGLDPNRDENALNPIMQLGSSTSVDEKKKSPMLSLSPFPTWFEKIGSTSGSNRVETNEKNQNEFSDSIFQTPEPVREIENQESIVKKEKQLDQKGKLKVSVRLPVKAKNGGNVDEEEEEEVEVEVETECSSEDEEPIIKSGKTWNLRPRKAAKKAENEGSGGGGGGRTRRSSAPARASKPRSAKSKARGKVEKAEAIEKRGLIVPLSKEEIENDFILMTGEKPSKKPTKRPKPVQKLLDGIFPGLYLNNITPETYGVPDPPLKM